MWKNCKLVVLTVLLLAGSGSALGSMDRMIGQLGSIVLIVGQREENSGRRWRVSSIGWQATQLASLVRTKFAYHRLVMKVMREISLERNSKGGRTPWRWEQGEKRCVSCDVHEVQRSMQQARGSVFCMINQRGKST